MKKNLTTDQAIQKLNVLLLKDLKKQAKSEINNFSIYTNLEDLKKYAINCGYLTKLKADKFTNAKMLKMLIISAIKTKQAKKYTNKFEEVKKILNAPDLSTAQISVEWKASKTWGANPTAECLVVGIGKTIGKASGCGYDKLSAAVAEALNAQPSILKALYLAKATKPNTPNRDLFGYGSGYSVLPYFEGGVGVNCYTSIFAKAGYKFTQTANGKMFDFFTITKSK